MTYDQFTAYIRIERSALGEESVMVAYGTAAAIAEVMGGKKTKALRKFANAVTPYYEDEVDPVPSHGDSADMGLLRRRIRAEMAAGRLN